MGKPPFYGGLRKWLVLWATGVGRFLIHLAMEGACEGQGFRAEGSNSFEKGCPSEHKCHAFAVFSIVSRFLFSVRPPGSQSRAGEQDDIGKSSKGIWWRIEACFLKDRRILSFTVRQRPGRNRRGALPALLSVLLFALAFLHSITSLEAEEGPRLREVPEYLGRVNDYASRLSHDAEMILEHISFQHEKQHGDRIILLTIDSLKGNDAEEFARRTLKTWELAGSSEEPTRVVLILLAVQEKRVRIHSSEGISEDLSAEKRAEILARAILPELKKQHYSIGLYRGFTEICQYLGEKHERRKALEKEEAKNKEKKESGESKSEKDTGEKKK
ncbi:MAG: hypothetical protein CMF59_18520 [Leptospiraceae bacterium]|nr:hypothetical protein [Leptospiraceae bacterium]